VDFRGGCEMFIRRNHAPHGAQLSTFKDIWKPTEGEISEASIFFEMQPLGYSRGFRLAVEMGSCSY